MPRFEQKISPLAEGRRKILFWEVEREGATLLSCSGEEPGASKRAKRVFDSEDEARLAMSSAIVKKLRAGFVEVGPSKVLPTTGPTPVRIAGSALLVDEYFAAGDERFLDEVLHLESASKLATLGERWYRDARPFARRMLLRYVDDGCDRPGHRVLVKCLFKLAEVASDDECMVHFLVAFDRFGGRSLVRVGRRWNPTLRQAEPILGLRGDPLIPARLGKDAKGEFVASPRFSRYTRMYLARRAFRYFRRLGRKDVVRYGLAMRAALPLYRDDDLSSAARLLDAWGLMHVLYGYSPILDKAPRGLRVKEGRSLSELTPAPYFPEAWDGVFDDLVAMLLQAKSRTVRQWTLTILRSKYEADLRALSFRYVKLLLKSEHEEIVHLGAELLPGLRELDTLPISEWLSLLRLENLDVLARVCSLVETHVASTRLGLEACIDLALSKAAPVAILGFSWAKEKPVVDRSALSIVLRLRSAGVPSVRRDGSTWCATLIEALAGATSDDLRDLCDAPFVDARAPGLACLERSPRFKDDIKLYFALTESPYDDVRAFVVRTAEGWQEKADPSTLVHLWATALLAVHRGSAAKRRVLVDLARRVATHPNEADRLLPILGIALRSVRAPERIAALGSLARAVFEQPSLRELVRTHLPEVTFGTELAR